MSFDHGYDAVLSWCSFGLRAKEECQEPSSNDVGIPRYDVPESSRKFPVESQRGLQGRLSRLSSAQGLGLLELRWVGGCVDGTASALKTQERS